MAACDRVEGGMEELTRVGEIMARRHLAGGMIVFPRSPHPLAPELTGRSGGIMHVGRGRCWKKNRSPEEVRNDIILVGLDAAWKQETLEQVRRQMAEAKAAGQYVVGFGPREAPQLAEHVKLCDAFFDNGVAPGDELAELRAGLVVDVLNAWALVAEHVAALTRHGKMPVMAKSFLYEDGPAWWNRYFGKAPFHEDLQVAPIPPGRLGRAYVGRLRALLERFRDSQLDGVRRAGELIAEELAAGRKTQVSYLGHMCPLYVGRGPDAAWARPWNMYGEAAGQIQRFRAEVPEGALTLRLGYAGLHKNLSDLFVQTRQRLILVTAENTRADWQITDQLKRQVVVQIDMGYAMGDACVEIEGYPIRAFPPSGVMQLVAYEAINAEVLARTRKPGAGRTQ